MASRRLSRLVDLVKETFGEEEAGRMMKNPLVVEEMREVARRYPASRIEEVFNLAKERGASKWAWITRSLEEGG